MNHEMCWYEYITGVWMEYDGDDWMKMTPCPVQAHDSHYTGHKTTGSMDDQWENYSGSYYDQLDVKD